MTILSAQRQVLYNQILNSVKNSPIQTINFEGNAYHFKLDYKLPYGECHYSRIFAKLIYLKECLGIITPGDTLLETTSGSGGRAAATIATALGYRIKIAVPAGGEKARERAIIMAGADIHLTPREAYVNGFPEFIKQFLKENPNTKYLSHMMGDIFGRGTSINGSAINAFQPFIEEVIESGIVPEIVICPLGNGTTTLPMAAGFKSIYRKARILGFEAASSAYVYRKKFGNDLYENNFHIKPEDLPRHNLPGTTPASTIFPAPALEKAISLLDEVSLVTNNFINNNFISKTGRLPQGCVVQCDEFEHPDMFEFGRTGKAGFFVALDYVRRHNLINKSIVIPVFDAAWHYDS